VNAFAIEINTTPTAYQCSNATGSYAWNVLGGGSCTNALTLAASGGASPGATYNCSAPVTADYHTVGAAPAVTCTSTVPSTAANNACYNVTSTASMAIPAASAFTLFTANVNAGQTLTLTSVSFDYASGCAGYVSGTSFPLLGPIKIAVQSDGTNVTATCTSAPLGLVETTGSPFTVNGGVSYYWEAASGNYSWKLVTPPALPSTISQCFGKSGTDEYTISIIPPSGVTIWYGGAAGTAGSSTGLVSPGTQTDYICLVSVGATEYQAIGPGIGTGGWTNH
jgi:hypothetical protein